MKYNSVPRTNLEVSQLSFGCMSLGHTESKDIDLIHRAIDKGINYFDTADLYDKGRNEVLLGKAVTGKRASVIIATKVGNEWNAEGTSWRWNPTKEYILTAVDKSLKRLQTDYIDIYQLHGGTIDDPIDETIEAFEILKDKGKIKAYGISSIRPNVIKEYVSRSNIVSNMMQYSLLDRRPEEAMLDYLKEHNIAVMVRGALAKGLLLNKTPREYLGHSGKDISTAQSYIQELTRETRSSAQVSTQYVLLHQAVTTAVIGFRNEEQLNDVIDGFDRDNLTQDERKGLVQQTNAFKYTKHR